MKGLGQISHDQALRWAKALFGDDVRLVEKAQSVYWDPVLMREIHEQAFDVRAPLPGFEVLLDARGQIVGFVDEQAWDGCGMAALPAEELRALIATSGLLPADYELGTAAAGSSSCLELRASHGPTAWRVRVNGARRILISIEPIDD